MATISITLDTQNIDTRLSSLKTAASGVDNALLSIKDAAKLLLPQFRQLALYTRVLATSNASLIKSANAVSAATSKVTGKISANAIATSKVIAANNRKIITDKNSVTADKKLEAQLHRVTKAENEAAISADRLAKQQAKVATASGKVSTSSKQLLPRVLKITASYMAMRTALRGVVNSFQGFLSFQDSMIRVGAITGATATEFRELTDAANRMGETTVWTADEAAKGLRILAQAGLNVSESISTLPGVLDLALIGSLDLEKATNIAIGTTNAFRLGLEQIGHVNDVLATASMSAITTVRELGVAMTYTAKAADIQGFSLEETTAMLEVLASGNLKAGRAGRYLATMMRKTGSAAKKLGLDAGTGLLEVLEKIRTTTLSTTELSALFGARAFQAAAILAQGLPAYEAHLQKLKEVDGATARLVDRIEKSLLNKLKLLRSALTGTVFESFGEGVGSLGEKISQLTETISQNKDEIIALLVGIGHGWGQVLTVLDSTDTVFGDFFESLMKGYAALPDIVKAVGLPAAIFFGVEGVAALGMISALQNVAAEWILKMKLISDGYITFAQAMALTQEKAKEMYASVHKDAGAAMDTLLSSAVDSSKAIAGLQTSQDKWNKAVKAGLKDTETQANTLHLVATETLKLKVTLKDTSLNYSKMTTAQKGLNKALADAKFEKSLIGLDKHDIAIAKLQRSYKSFKVVNEDAAKAWLAYRLAVLKANEENDAAKKKLSGVTAELSKLRKELKEEQFGAATDSLDSYEKKLVTLDHELENHIEKIKEKTDRTEEEKLKLIDLEEQIYAVKRARVISADNLAREKREAEGVNSELDRMSKELDKTGKKNKETTDLMADAWASFDSSLEGVLAGTFSGEFESIGGMFKDLLSSMYSNFINWAAKVAAQQIVFNISSGQAGANTLGSMFSGLFGGGSDGGGFNPTTGILGGIATKGKDLWSGYQSGGLSGAWDTATGWFGGGASSGASYLSGLGNAGYGATAAYGAQGVFDAGRYSGTFLQGSVGDGSMWASSAGSSASSSALSTASEIMPFVAAAYSYYSLATADEKTPQNVGGAMSATVAGSAALAGAGPVGWVAAIPMLVLSAVQMIGENQRKPSREYFDPYYSRELGDDKYFVAGRKVASQEDQTITDNSWDVASSKFLDIPRNWNVVYDKKTNAFYNIDSSDLYDPETKGSLFPEYYASDLVDQNAAAIAAGYGDKDLTYDSIFSLIANSKVSDYDQTDIPIELQKQLKEWQQPASMKDLVDAGVITEEEFLSRVNSAIESGVAEKLQYYEFKDELAVAQYGKAQKYPMMLKSLQSAFPVEDILEGMLDEAKTSAGALKSNYAESLGGLFDEAVEGAIDGLDMTAIQSTLGEGYNETANEINTQLTEAMTPIQERFQILSDIATAVDPSETHLMTYKDQVAQITAAYDESEKKLVDLGATQTELTKLDDLETMAKKNLKEQTEKSIDVILNGVKPVSMYQQQMDALKEQFDAQEKVLVALGATTEQVAQNTANYNDALAQLKIVNDSSIDSIITGLGPMGQYQTQIQQTIGSYAQATALLVSKKATQEKLDVVDNMRIETLADLVVASDDTDAALKILKDSLILAGETTEEVGADILAVNNALANRATIPDTSISASTISSLMNTFTPLSGFKDSFSQQFDTYVETVQTLIESGQVSEEQIKAFNASAIDSFAQLIAQTGKQTEALAIVKQVLMESGASDEQISTGMQAISDSLDGMGTGITTALDSVAKGIDDLNRRTDGVLAYLPKIHGAVCMSTAAVESVINGIEKNWALAAQDLRDWITTGVSSEAIDKEVSPIVATEENFREWADAAGFWGADAAAVDIRELWTEWEQYMLSDIVDRSEHYGQNKEKDPLADAIAKINHDFAVMIAQVEAIKDPAIDDANQDISRQNGVITRLIAKVEQWKDSPVYSSLIEKWTGEIAEAEKTLLADQTLLLDLTTSEKELIAGLNSQLALAIAEAERQAGEGARSDLVSAARGDLITALQSQVTELENLSDTLAQERDAWQNASKSLREAALNIISTAGGISPEETLKDAGQAFAAEIKKVWGGDVEAAGNLPGMANTYLNAGLKTSSTSVEYRRLAGQIAGQLSSAADIADSKAADADTQIIDILTASGEDSLEYYKNALRTMGALNDEVLSVEDAISNYTDAILAQLDAGDPVDPTDIIEYGFLELLGRFPDAGGFDYYFDQLTTDQLTATAFINALMDSNEYQDRHRRSGSTEPILDVLGAIGDGVFGVTPAVDALSGEIVSELSALNSTLDTGFLTTVEAGENGDEYITVTLAQLLADTNAQTGDLLSVATRGFLDQYSATRALQLTTIMAGFTVARSVDVGVSTMIFLLNAMMATEMSLLATAQTQINNSSFWSGMIWGTLQDQSRSIIGLLDLISFKLNTSANITAEQTAMISQSVYSSAAMISQSVYSSAAMISQRVYSSAAMIGQRVYSSAAMIGQRVYSSAAMIGQRVYSSAAMIGQSVYSSAAMISQSIYGSNFSLRTELARLNFTASVAAWAAVEQRNGMITAIEGVRDHIDMLGDTKAEAPEFVQIQSGDSSSVPIVNAINSMQYALRQLSMQQLLSQRKVEKIMKKWDVEGTPEERAA